jgi:hypothetical protein
MLPPEIGLARHDMMHRELTPAICHIRCKADVVEVPLHYQDPSSRVSLLDTQLSLFRDEEIPARKAPRKSD